ncbi:MAG TPA: hypothetical protein VKB54_14060 [Solirubrobacteraceae bacterium]|nr:hypothetical protein [Solirubrobacteraceae bacterium]
MDSQVRVCPFCGEPPGAGVFCESCGRNLSAVEQLPTRAQWDVEHAGPADERPLAERCEEATREFLAAMHAGGDPGAQRFEVTRTSGWGRTHYVQGWLVRPVYREDDADIRQGEFEPGLVLTVEGDYRRLDSEVRGWGQRDFPQFHDTVAPEPIEMPVEGRLIGELAAVRSENGA